MNLRLNKLILFVPLFFFCFLIGTPQPVLCKPIQLVCIVDDSGSMYSQDPNVLRKDAIELIVKEILDEDDRFALVSFSKKSMTDVLYPLSFLDLSAQVQLSEVIPNIKNRRSNWFTDIYAGLQNGIEELGKGGEGKYILLLTDGEPWPDPREYPEYHQGKTAFKAEEEFGNGDGKLKQKENVMDGFVREIIDEYKKDIFYLAESSEIPIYVVGLLNKPMKSTQRGKFISFLNELAEKSKGKVIAVQDYPQLLPSLSYIAGKLKERLANLSLPEQFELKRNEIFEVPFKIDPAVEDIRILVSFSGKPDLKKNFESRLESGGRDLELVRTLESRASMVLSPGRDVRLQPGEYKFSISWKGEGKLKGVVNVQAITDITLSTRFPSQGVAGDKISFFSRLISNIDEDVRVTGGTMYFKKKERKQWNTASCGIQDFAINAAKELDVGYFNLASGIEFQIGTGKNYGERFATAGDLQVNAPPEPEDFEIEIRQKSYIREHPLVPGEKFIIDQDYYVKTTPEPGKPDTYRLKVAPNVEERLNGIQCQLISEGEAVDAIHFGGRKRPGAYFKVRVALPMDIRPDEYSLPLRLIGKKEKKEEFITIDFKVRMPKINMGFK